MKKVISIFFLLITLFIYQSTDGKNGLDFFRIFPNWSSVQDKPSELNDPELTGPDRLCNVFGSVIGTFSGGGAPGDIYQWTILGPEGQVLFTRPGGAFPSINYTFSINGTHRVELSISRGSENIANFSKDIEVIKGPDIVLLPENSICENQTITLQALDPLTQDFSAYQFEWYDKDGNFLSDQNELDIDAVGEYSVILYFLDNMGVRVCENQLSTRVTQTTDYQLISNFTEVCPDLPTTLATVPNVSGQWKYQKEGSTDLVNLGFGNTITILPNQNLPEVGNYKIFFEPANSSNSPCLTTKSLELIYNPQPEFVVLNAIPATECNALDGKLTIQAITPLDQVLVDGLGITSPPIAAGDTYTFTDLKSGSYSLISILGNCANSFGSVVPLENPPSQLVFKIKDIIGEQCTDVGKTQGSFLIAFDNPPSTGFYRIINEKGTLVQTNDFQDVSSIPITISGGGYYVEVYNNEDCNVPEADQVTVPGLSQTNFNIPSELFVCQSFDLVPETNQSLEFTLIYLDGSKESQLSGAPFSITQEGDYRLIGVLPNQSEICPTIKEFTVKLVEPIDFEPKLISEDCTVGNRTFEADIFGADPSTAIFLWKNENGETVGTGQFLFLPPSAFGEYSLEVQPAGSQSCPIPPKKFLVKEPVLSVEVSLTSTKLCEFGPRAILSVTTTNPEEVTNIVWRRFDDSGQIIELDEFKDRNEIIAEVEGIYEASVYSIIPAINKDCELGRNTFNLDLTTEKVSFTIPDQLSICDPYPLIPQSNEPLSFILTYPDGTTQEKEWNEAFEISMEGTYTILGFNPDVTFPLCPEQKSFDVKINQPVEFNTTLLNLTCEGTYEFFATLSNYTPDEVDFFWRDAAGTLLGTDQTIFLSQYGTFELDVQPKGSIPCADTKLTFEAPTPVLSLPVDMLQDPYCPDQPNTRLELISTFETVTEIQWWFTDISGIKNQLISESNKREIVIIEEGTYEAIILNQYNCILGTDQRLVLKSQDTVRPEVQVSYQICPRYEIAETINPGSFASYEWYFENNLVSTNTTFKPAQIGQHQLIVTSTEGCRYQTSFLTEEECEFKVVVPSAMIPGNPDKNFLIYTNYLIDDLEIWIFNKWGQIIYHCKNSNLISEQSTCAWDGYFDGKKVPPGSYAYRMNFKNLEKNISQFQLGSIMVIE